MSLLSVAFGITNFLVVVSFLSDSTYGCNPDDHSFVCFEYGHCLLRVDEPKNYFDAQLDCENRCAELATLDWDVFDGTTDNIVYTLIERFFIHNYGVYILTQYSPVGSYFRIYPTYERYPYDLVHNGTDVLNNNTRGLLFNAELNGDFSFTLREMTEKSPFLCRYKKK